MELKHGKIKLKEKMWNMKQKNISLFNNMEQ